MDTQNKLITEEDVEQKEVDHVEESARFIKLLHDQFRKLGYNLANRKKRAVVRVLESVMFEPLESVELFGKEEKELVDICNQIMYHKNKIAEFAIKRRMEAEQADQKGEQE